MVPSASTTFTANVEEYNGSSWSEQNNLSTPGARRGCGTQTAGLVFGGTQAPPVLDATEEYDGTNWTNGGSMNVGRNQLTGCGIQTSALAISGGTSPAAGTGAVEQYNGSTWTTISSINTTRYDMGSSAANADHALGWINLDNFFCYNGDSQVRYGRKWNCRGRIVNFRKIRT